MEKRLCTAARVGDDVTLQNLLDPLGGEEVTEYVNSAADGPTPLLLAVQNHHKETVRLLVERYKADVNKQGSVVTVKENSDNKTVTGATPLWTAAEVGDRELVDYLLYKCADVNRPTDDSCIPLMVASYNGSLHAVRMLVMHGSDINRATKCEHYTSLINASQGGDPSVIEYLISRGAEIDKVDRRGRSDFFRVLCSTSLAGRRKGALQILLLKRKATSITDSTVTIQILLLSTTGIFNRPSGEKICCKVRFK